MKKVGWGSKVRVDVAMFALAYVCPGDGFLLACVCGRAHIRMCVSVGLGCVYVGDCFWCVSVCLDECVFLLGWMCVSIGVCMSVCFYCVCVWMSVSVGVCVSACVDMFLVVCG